MRIDPICNHIARQLNTVVAHCLPDGTRDRIWCTRPDFHDPLLSLREIQSFLFSESDTPAPMLYLAGGPIAYIRFSFEGGYYLTGPVRLKDRAAMLARAKYILERELPEPEDLPALGCCGAIAFFRAVLLLYNVLMPRDLGLFDCMNANFTPERANDKVFRTATIALFENRETLTVHNPYGQEMRMLQAISDGDVKKLQASWEETYPGVLGTTSKNPIRNAKYIAQYVVSACARAAIRGGLQPELSFTLTDSYCQQIDGLQDLSLLESIVWDAELQLTLMVRDIKAASKKAVQPLENIPVVENAKQYIFAHLHSRLTVQEVADSLKIHPSYLSSLFKKQEGVGVYRYITAQKIDLVKNLLRRFP